MFCPNCGAENANGTKFCASCGAGLAAPAAESAAPVAEPVAETPAAAPKESIGVAIKSALNDLVQIVKPLGEKLKPIVQKNKLLLTAIGGALILLICICTIIGALTAGNGFTPFKHTISAMIKDEVLYVRYDKKMIETDLEAESIEQTGRSLDGSIYAFLTSEGELAVVKGKKVTVVAEDVEGFYMSVNGKGIVYAVEDEDDEESCVYLYNVGNKKSKLVTDEGENLTGLAISPNGKSVAYGLYDEEDDENKIMYFKGSDSIRVASGQLNIIGMSNNGKQIYMASYNEDEDGGSSMELVCYNTKGDKQKLGKLGGSSIRFNEDHTQIMFYSEGKTYISNKGKEAEKVSNSEINMLMAPNATSLSSMGTTYPVDNLYKHVYTGYDSNGNYSVWYIHKNSNKTYKLVSDVSSVKMDESCDYLYYIDDDDNLKVLKLSQGENAGDKAKTLAEDASGTYVVTSDRSKLYFMSDGGLYVVNGKKGGSKKTIASDDVDSVVINKKDVVFYSIEGDVYATSNSSKGKRVASDITELYRNVCGLVFAENEDTLYVSNGPKKLTKIWEAK